MVFWVEGFSRQGRMLTSPFLFLLRTDGYIGIRYIEKRLLYTAKSRERVRCNSEHLWTGVYRLEEYVR